MSSRLLQALLLMSLLLAALIPSTFGQADDGEPYFELRCLCVKTYSGIRPRHIRTVRMTTPGPQCPNVEVIATLTDGREVCLDPEAPSVKKLLEKLLQSQKLHA